MNRFSLKFAQVFHGLPTGFPHGAGGAPQPTSRSGPSVRAPGRRTVVAATWDPVARRLRPAPSPEGPPAYQVAHALRARRVARGRRLPSRFIGTRPSHATAPQPVRARRQRAVGPDPRQPSSTVTLAPRSLRRASHALPQSTTRAWPSSYCHPCAPSSHGAVRSSGTRTVVPDEAVVRTTARLKSTT